MDKILFVYLGEGPDLPLFPDGSNILVTSSKISREDVITLDSDLKGSDLRNDVQHRYDFSHFFYVESGESIADQSLPLLQNLDLRDEIVRVLVKNESSVSFRPKLVPKDCLWKRPVMEIPIIDKPIRSDPRIVVEQDSISLETRYNIYKSLSAHLEKDSDPDTLFECAVLASFFDPTKARYYSNKFLSHHSGTIGKRKEQTLLMRYLSCYLLFYRERRAAEAIREIRKVISLDPSFAEFWCLLGDCYLSLSSPIQAKEMFEMASLLGETSDLLNSERIWIDLDKYGDYPLARIEECDGFLQEKGSGRIS